MIDWYLENDDTEPVIQARVHARSEHRGELLDLPETAVLFFQSQGVPYLQAHHPVVTLTEMLPRFLFPTPVYAVKGEEGVCFLDGGRGAPQGADTVETLFALGVKKFILVGYCGCFAGEVGLCDAVAPPRILVEEGTSHHYHPRIRWAAPSPELHRQAVAFLSPRLRVWEQPTVTTDAVYRQTVRKEALWRQQGCVGVDMEASAVLSVSQYLGAEAVALLLVSDKHPTAEDPTPWSWGVRRRVEARDRFFQAAIDFAFAQGR